jgi:hypothetical protein
MGDKEEKGTRTGGTGSQGNQGPTGGGDRSANQDRADITDRTSIENYSPPDPRSTEADVRGGRQAGGVGSDQGAGGVAVGGAFGRDPEVSDDDLPGGDLTGHLGGQSGGGSGGERSGESRNRKG